MTTSSSWQDSGLGQSNPIDRNTPPLIDFGSVEDARSTAPSGSKRPLALDAGAGVSPTDKLRSLLRQMESEARAARPTPTPSQRYVDASRSSATQMPTPTPAAAHLADSESEDSPPSPPPRITNPYLKSLRAAQQQRQERERERAPVSSSPSLPRRLPSRAIALQAAAAAAAAKQASPPREHPATPLETFIASHATAPMIAEPSSSRQHLDNTPRPQSPSRKGKERADSNGDGQTPMPRRARSVSLASPHDSESDTEYYTTAGASHGTPRELASPPRRRVGPTPRRTTVASPPDSSIAFAAGLASGEGDVDLDIGDDLPWDDTLDSVNSYDPRAARVDGPTADRASSNRLLAAEERGHDLSRQKSTERSFERSYDASSRRTPEKSFDRSYNTSEQRAAPLARQWSRDSESPQELSRQISREREEERSRRMEERQRTQELSRQLSKDSAHRSLELSRQLSRDTSQRSRGHSRQLSDDIPHQRSPQYELSRQRSPTGSFDRDTRPKPRDLSRQRSIESLQDRPKHLSHKRSTERLDPRELTNDQSRGSREQTPSFATAPSRTLQASTQRDGSFNVSGDTSLPPLPAPDSSDDEEDNPALRQRAGLFRSSPRATPQSWSRSGSLAVSVPRKQSSPTASPKSPLRESTSSTGSFRDPTAFVDAPSGLSKSTPSLHEQAEGTAFRHGRHSLRESRHSRSPSNSPETPRRPLKRERSELFSESTLSFRTAVIGGREAALRDEREAVLEEAAFEEDEDEAYTAQLEEEALEHEALHESVGKVHLSPRRPVLDDVVCEESDTLPGTPSPPLHRLSSVLGAPAGTPADFPRRSSLKATERATPRQSTNVRWSPEVLSSEPVSEDATSPTTPPQPASTSPQTTPTPQSRTPQATPPRRDSTSPDHTPPRQAYAATPAARTPRFPGAFGTPLPALHPPPHAGLPALPASQTPARGLQTPGLPTPRPPGAWYTPSGRTLPQRFSTLRNEVRPDDTVSSIASSIHSNPDVSVHRLRVSPRAGLSPRSRREEEPESPTTANGPPLPLTPTRQMSTSSTSSPSRPSPRVQAAMDEDDENAEADQSFTARVRRFISPRKQRRTAELATAQTALDAATHASAEARDRVQAAQAAWLSALASLPPDAPPQVVIQHAQAAMGSDTKPVPLAAPAVAVPETRRRGLWVSYLLLELVLLWAVFRVTLEYATSAHILAQRDPWTPRFGGYAVGAVVPSALDVFALPRARQGNLFDLLDAMGIGSPGRQWFVPS